MAAIENLEIIVDVDIASAIAALEELQEELLDIAEAIETVDAIGTEGIDVRASVDNLDNELAAEAAKIQAFERSQSIDIPMNVHDRSFTEILARAGVSSVDEFGGGGITRGGGGDIDGPTFGRLGRNVRRLTGSLGNLTRRLRNFDLRMSDIHNAIARLVPILLVFLGTIPALITALVGLATAAIAAAASLAAIAGLGALGVGLQDGEFDMQRLTDVWEEIRDDFIEAFAPLAERLEPLFMDAVDGLEMFFNAVANQGDALMALTDEARAFGGFIIDFMPTLLRTLSAVVEALSPIFSGIASFLQREFNQVMRDLVDLTARAIPVIAEMVLKLGRAIPALVKFSIGITRAANAFLTITGALFDFLGLLGVSPQMLGAFTGALLVAATGVLLLNSSLLATAAGGLMKVGAMLIGHITRLLGVSAASVLATIASWGLYRALVALLGLTVVGLALVGISQAASAMADNFMGAASGVDSLTNSLREFDRVSGRMDGGGFNPYGQGTQGAGAADRAAGRGTAGVGGGVVVNIEGGRNRDDDRSNARKASWRMGRTTGSDN